MRIRHTLSALAILSILLTSCNDKIKIKPDQSQSFEKFYGNLYEDYGYDVKSLPHSTAFPNGGYVVAGSTSITATGGSKGNKNMLLLFLDNYGNIVGKPKQYGGTEDAVAHHINVLPGGAGFVLTGYATSGGQRHASILNVNAAGDQQWNYISSIPNSSAEEALNLHYDSVAATYIVVGYQTLNAQQNGWIFDLNANGKYDSTSAALLNISNIKNLNGNYQNLNVEFQDISILNSPYIAIYGSFVSPNTPGVLPFNRSVVFVCKKQGNYNIFNNDGPSTVTRLSNDFPMQMVILPGNKGAFLSSIDTIIGNSSRSVRIAQFDDPTLPSSSTKKIWNLSDSNGSLDAVSMKYNSSDNTFIILATVTLSSGKNIVLIKMDASSGQESWRQYFGENGNFVAGAFDIAPDGGFIITGYNSTGGYNQSVVVIKTDKDGLLQ